MGSYSCLLAAMQLHRLQIILASFGVAASAGFGFAPVARTAPRPQAVSQSPDRQNTERQIASYESYLERKPYHDWAFDKLVEAAVSAGTLEARVEVWRARFDENPGAEAPRIVLARLLAATDEWDEALEILAGVKPMSGAAYRLVGGLERKRGRSEAAAAAFGLAVAGTEDPALLETLHGEHARALLEAGEREAAVAAFRALAELRPDSFHLRVEAAAQLADGGLIDEAASTLDEALTLAGDDPEKRSRTLVELAKVHERRGDAPEAVAAYWQCLELLGRGHWLRRQIGPRLVGLAQRMGQVDVLLERSGIDASQGSDLAALELHASFLTAAGRREEAREALERAVEAFPTDLPLARSLMGLYAADSMRDEHIALLQRTIGEHPRELELYVALGQEFAADGRLDAARREWQRSLEQRVDDPGLCIRLAALFAVHDQVEDAASMYERAIALNPGELRTYGELAAFLDDRGRVEEAAGVLERAASVATDRADSLEELAELWTAHGAPEKARAALEAALALVPEDAGLMSRLAERCYAEGDVARSTDLLWGAVSASTEIGLRRASVDRLVRQAEKVDGLADLQAEAEKRAALEGAGPSPFLVLAKVYRRLRKTRSAEQQLNTLVERFPEVDEGWLQLAQLHELDGSQALALETYERFAEQRPQAKRRVLRDMARVHLALRDHEKAKDCYEQILRIAPDIPAAWLEVADSYERLGFDDDALRCVRQALRLEPENGATRLRLADLYRDQGEWERSMDEVLTVTRSADRDSREIARGRYYDMLRELGEIDQRMEELRVAVQDNPYDIEGSLALSDLYTRESEYELALQTVDSLLAFQPREPRLLQERGWLLEKMDRWEEAREVRRDMAGIPEVDAQANSLGLARTYLELGDLERAKQTLSAVRDRGAVASLYRRQSMDEQAIDVLNASLSGTNRDVSVLFQLSSMYAERSEYEKAIEALEGILALRGNSWDLVQRIGSLHHRAGSEDATLAAGKELFELLRSPDEAVAAAGKTRQSFSRNMGRNYYDIRNWFQSNGLAAEYPALILAEAQIRPKDSELLIATVSALSRKSEFNGPLLDLIHAARAATIDDPPARFDAAGWARVLWNYESDIYARDSELADKGLEHWATDPLRCAGILNRSDRAGEAVDLLEEQLGEQPEDVTLLSAAANYAMGAELWDRALANLGALLPLVDDEARELTPEEIEAKAKGRPARLRSLRRRYSRRLQRELSDEDLERIATIADIRIWALPTIAKNKPSRSAVLLARAKSLGKSGDLEGAEEILRGLAQAELVGLRDLVSLGQVGVDLELQAFTVGCYERFLEGYWRHQDNPIERHGHGLTNDARRAALGLAKLHEEAGDPLAAYKLISEWGQPDAARLILSSHDIRESALAAFQDALGEASTAAERRNAQVRVAEVQQASLDWDGALRSYSEILETDPNDVLVWQNVALLHERAGRWEEAVAAFDRTVECTRLHNQRVARNQVSEDRLLRPFKPQLPNQDSDSSWTFVRQTASLSARDGRYLGAVKLEPRTSYVSKLKILLDHREVGRAAESLRNVMREDPSILQWFGYSLGNIVEQYGFKEEALPLLRLMASNQVGGETIRWQYGESLYKTNRLDEARPVLRKMVADPAVQDYYKNRARNLLADLEERLGLTSNVTLDDLRRAVAEDPKNVAKRIDLVARLRSENLLEEATEQVLVAADLAPHRDEIQVTGVELLAESGRDDEAEALLLAAMEQSKDEEFRVQRGAQLAGWAWDRGEHGRATEILDMAFTKKVREDYSPAAFYLERGDVEAALRCLREDLELAPEYRRQQIEMSLRSLAGQLGSLEDAIRPIRDSLKAMDRSVALDQGLIAFIESITGRDDLSEQVPTAIAAAEASGDLLGAVEAAALEIAVDRWDDAQERLSAAAADPADGRYLVPTLIYLARRSGHPERAADLLNGLIQGGTLSKTETFFLLDLGMFSEHNLALAELGLVQAELGDASAALATWKSMAKGRQGSEGLMPVYLAQEAGLFEIALDEVNVLLEEANGRNKVGLTLKADLLEQLGRWTEIPPVLDTWLVLEDDETTRKMLQGWRIRAHHKAGTLDALLATQEANWERDPDDLDLARDVALLRGLAGDQDGQTAVLESLAELPALAPKVLPTLLQRSLAARDLDHACRMYERLLQVGGNSWEVRQTKRDFTNLLIHHERLDEALAMATADIADKESVEARMAKVEVYAKAKQWSETVRETTAVLQHRPDHRQAKKSLAEALRALDAWDELLALCQADLADPAARNASITVLGHLPHAIEEQGAGADLIAAASGSTRAEDYLAAAIVHRSRKQHDLEVACLEEALLLAPRDGYILGKLSSARKAAKDWDGALEAVEQEIILAGRKFAGQPSDYTLKSKVTRLRRTRASIHGLKGDFDGIAETLTNRDGLRYDSLAVHAFRHGTSSYRNFLSTQANEIAQYERYAEAHALVAPTQAAAAPGQRLNVEAYRWRMRAGDIEGTLHELWSRIPISPFHGLGGSGQVTIWSATNVYEESGQPGAVLLQLAKECGRIQEWAQRLVELADSAAPGDERAQQIRLTALKYAGRWQERAALLEERFAKNDDGESTDLLLALAEAYEESGQSALALERYDNAADRLEAAVSAEANYATAWSKPSASRARRPKTRFQYEVQRAAAGFGGATSYGGRRDSGAVARVRMARAGLQLQAGDREAARALELEALDQEQQRIWEGKGPGSSLAARYEALGLYADAARFEEERFRLLTELDGGRLNAASHDHRMAQLWTKAEEPDRARPYIEGFLSSLDESLKETTEPAPRSATLLRRARFLLEVAGDLEGARRDGQRSVEILAEAGEKLSAGGMGRAEFLRKLGEADRAWDAAQEYLNLMGIPWLRFGLSPDDRYTLALLLAEREEPLQLRTRLLLWTCLNDAPQDERAALVRTALAR